jgi:predicted Zn-dependent protease
VRPQAESFCREENPGRPRDFCTFTIRLVENPRMPPNAFQTIGNDGRPLLVMTSTCSPTPATPTRSPSCSSHEAGHHVAGHLQRQQVNVAIGALILGSLAAATIGPGTDRASADRIVADAMDLGAFAGQRVYSQAFELEADTLGAFIAARSGYSPDTGALMFYRIPSASGPQSLWSTASAVAPAPRHGQPRLRGDPPPAGARPGPARPRPSRPRPPPAPG